MVSPKRCANVTTISPALARISQRRGVIDGAAATSPSIALDPNPTVRPQAVQRPLGIGTSGR